MPIDLGHLTGLIPHQVEQAILRLREAIEDVQEQNQLLASAVAATPPPPTMSEIQQALSPAGSNPLPVSGFSQTESAQTAPVPPAQPQPGQQVLNGWGAICTDGLQVQCSGPLNLPPTVQFGNDTPIPLPEPGQYLDAVSVGANHLAIVKGFNTAQAYLIDRVTATVTALGLTYGTYPVGLRTDGTPLWQDTDSTYMIGGVSTPIPAPFAPTAIGFLSIDAGGDPVWTQEQITTPIVLDGVTFLLASRDGDWTVGNDVTTDQFLAYRHSTGTLFFAGPRNNSTIAARVAQQSDGSCILARSLPTSWFLSVSFVLYNPVTPPPADDIDLSTVIWVKGLNLITWSKTSTLQSPAHAGTVLTTAHTMDGTWPIVNVLGNPAFPRNANQWLFAFIGGQWYAGATQLLAPGDPTVNYNSPVGATYFAGTFLETWNPAPGESVGVMVSCPAISSQWTLSERSNNEIIIW